jgi:DNA-binding transcriptional regulator YiaG
MKMTTTQYREAIAALGLSQNAAAAFLGVNERTSRSWAGDRYPVPQSVAMLLWLMVERNIKPAAVLAVQERREG